jgi:hypothetical protein
MTFFDIVVSTSASLHPEMEPDQFISSYQTVIRAEGNNGVLLGAIRCSLGREVSDDCQAVAAEVARRGRSANALISRYGAIMCIRCRSRRQGRVISLGARRLLISGKDSQGICREVLPCP